MGKLGNALILSPFATHPLDAGQRKRAFQTTSFLKEWGFSITFLHFAFETRWYWGHNSEDDERLKEQWDGDVLHFYANKNVGLPPINRKSHQLDEWWDEALGGYINNIFSKRKYDIFVVHNIWLSKAFDHAPYHCLKVLEMHDLFSHRAKEFEATGAPPEFFYCSEESEIFGLKRADLLFAIKREDADWCEAQDLGSTQVITIPYIEHSASNPIEVDQASHDMKPLHPGKVVFGMIGSDIHFNRHAVNALIKELDIVIRETYAPLQFVLAGSICRSVGECPGFVEKLGFVDQVSDFYSSVDVVMVPMLHGTGVKIKSVEALNYRKPVLFTKHSAEGTGFEGRICNSLTDMANWAAEIALEGTLPCDLVNNCLTSIATTKAWATKAKDNFLLCYQRKRPSFLQIMGTTEKSQALTLLETFSGLSLYKELTNTFRTQGICIQPSMSQYLASVPSQPLFELKTMTDVLEAWVDAQFVIISFSQRELLNTLIPHKKPELIIIDCRLVSVERLRSSELTDLAKDRKIFYLLTPMQMALVDETLGISINIFPISTERSTWDPHLKSLHANVLDNSHHIPPKHFYQIQSEAMYLRLLNKNKSDKTLLFCDLRVVVEEAIQELYSIIQESLPKVV